MPPILRNCALAALLTIAVTATPALASGQKVLSFITATDTEAQAMALVLANQMKAAGNDVSLLTCGAAGDMALKAAPASMSKVVTPKGMTVTMLLAGFMKQGGKVDVCAIYLPNRKLGKDALVDGVGVAEPAAIAARMTDPSVRVIGN